jgi:hypothetical protein
MQSFNTFNLNKEYINKLMKIKGKDKTELAKLLNITPTVLRLKMSNKTLLYIDEGVIIAEYLEEDITKIFNPDNKTMYDTLYNTEICIEDVLNKKVHIKKEKMVYNHNKEYIKKIMAENNITISGLCYLFSLKQASVYDKIRGATKITLKEGLLMAKYCNTDVKTLFCPTHQEIIEKLASSFNTEYNNGIDNKTIIISDYKIILQDFDINNLVQKEKILWETIKNDNKLPKELEKIWNLSLTQIYNKLKNNTKITFNEALLVCKWLNKPLRNFFYTKKELGIN